MEFFHVPYTSVILKIKKINFCIFAIFCSTFHSISTLLLSDYNIHCATPQMMPWDPQDPKKGDGIHDSGFPENFVSTTSQTPLPPGCRYKLTVPLLFCSLKTKYCRVERTRLLTAEAIPLLLTPRNCPIFRQRLAKKMPKSRSRKEMITSQCVSYLRQKSRELSGPLLIVLSPIFPPPTQF